MALVNALTKMSNTFDTVLSLFKFMLSQILWIILADTTFDLNSVLVNVEININGV